MYKKNIPIHVWCYKCELLFKDQNLILDSSKTEWISYHYNIQGMNMFWQHFPKENKKLLQLSMNVVW